MRCLIISLSIIQFIYLCQCDLTKSSENKNKNVIDLLLQSVVNAISGNSSGVPPLPAAGPSVNETEEGFDRRETGGQNGSNWDAISKFMWKPIVAPIDLTARPANPLVTSPWFVKPTTRSSPTTTTSTTTTTLPNEPMSTDWMPTLPLINDEDLDSITLSNLFNEHEDAFSTSTKKNSLISHHLFTIAYPTIKVQTISARTSTPSPTTTFTTTTTTTTIRPSPVRTTEEEIFKNNRKFPYNTPFYPYNPYPSTISRTTDRPTTDRQTTDRPIPKDFITIAIPELPVIKGTVIAGNFDQTYAGSTSKWNLITIDNPMKSSSIQHDTSTPKTLYKDDKITLEPLFVTSTSNLMTDTSTMMSDQETFTKNKRYRRDVGQDYEPVAIDLSTIIEDEQEEEVTKESATIPSTTRGKRTKVKVEVTKPTRKSKPSTASTTIGNELDHVEVDDEQDEIDLTVKPKGRMPEQEATTTTAQTSTLSADEDEQDESLTWKPRRTSIAQLDEETRKVNQRRRIKTTTPYYEEEDEEEDYEPVAIYTKAKMIGPVAVYTRYPVNPKMFDYQYDYDDDYDLYRPIKMNRELVNGQYGRQTTPGMYKMTRSRDRDTTTSTTERARASWPTLPTLPTLPPLLTIKPTMSDMSLTVSMPKLPRWFLQIFESLAPKTTPGPQTTPTVDNMNRETPGELYDESFDEEANFKMQNSPAPTLVLYTEMPRHTRLRDGTRSTVSQMMTRPVPREHSHAPVKRSSHRIDTTVTPFINSDQAEYHGHAQARPHSRQRSSTSVVPISYQGDREGGQVGTNSGQSVSGLGLANGQGGIVIGNNSGNGKRPAKRPKPS